MYLYSRENLAKVASVRPICQLCPENQGFDGAVGSPVTISVCKARGCRPCNNKVSMALEACPKGLWDNRVRGQSSIRPYLAHVSGLSGDYVACAAKTAADLGLDVRHLDVKLDVYRTAGVIKQAALVLVWNGAQHYAPLVTRLCRMRNIPILFYEWGVLPQSETFLCDPMGLCGDSILCDDLSWVTGEDREKMAQVRAEMQAKYPLRPEPGSVLVLLQIENDSQILYHTSYNSMRDFVADMAEEYEGRQITVRPHPKTTTQVYPELPSVTVDRAPSLLEQAARHELVVGLTSTALYEAALLGVPVKAYGRHPLSYWSQEPKRQDVLAGLLAMRIQRKGGSFAPTVRRFNMLREET